MIKFLVFLLVCVACPSQLYDVTEAYLGFIANLPIDSATKNELNSHGIDCLMSVSASIIIFSEKLNFALESRDTKWIADNILTLLLILKKSVLPPCDKTIELFAALQFQPTQIWNENGNLVGKIPQTKLIRLFKNVSDHLTSGDNIALGRELAYIFSLYFSPKYDV